MLNNLTQRCERLPRMMERGCESERHAIIATSDGVAVRHTIETDTYLLMVAHREVDNDDCLFQLLSWLFSTMTTSLMRLEVAVKSNS